MARFRQITIVGLGLIGGSLGLAVRRRHLAGRVVGLSRRAATIRLAKRLGAINTGTTNAQQAVRDADIVIIATPVETIVPQAKRLARWMKPGSVITDVGSTKAGIVKGLGSLPRGIAFVGGHPVGGSEQRGLDAAELDLFEDAFFILTPTTRTPRTAVARVTALWEPLVKRVVVMDPASHDRVMAQTSHLTHAVAFTLSRAGAGADMISPSFLDATRVAKSDPALWDDIFLTNRREILRAIERFEREWRRLKQVLSRADRAGLLKFLARAKQLRDALE